jgi:hypothetical protein
MKRIVEKESSIQQACTDMLLLDGWRVLHTDLKHLRGMGVQEPGIADDLFIRYWTGCINQIEKTPPYESWAQVLFIEWKRIDPRGLRTKASQKQKDWHTLERKRGALTLIAGQDFEPTTEGFKNWYVNSGLMRNKIL